MRRYVRLSPFRLQLLNERSAVVLGPFLRCKQVPDESLGSWHFLMPYLGFLFLHAYVNTVAACTVVAVVYTVHTETRMMKLKRERTFFAW